MATSTTTVFIFLVVIFNFATLLVTSTKHDCTINPTAKEEEMLEKCKQLSKDPNNHLNKQIDAAAQEHGSRKITKEMLEESKVVVQVAVAMNVLKVVETHGSGGHEHQCQLNVDHALQLANEYIDRMAKVSEEIREKMKTDIAAAAVKNFGEDSSETETDDNKIAKFAKTVQSILNKVCNFKQHAENTDRRRRRRR